MRKLAAIRGLVTHALRSRAWPLLLGVQDQSHDERDYVARREMIHKDSHVVECDMLRSLWSWTEGWTDEERDKKRAALKRILDATIAGNAGDLHYYQGLHDVAAVLLFVCGEAPAYRMLSRLAQCHLRDCTRPKLEAAIEALSLLYPILSVADPELHAHITGLHEPALEVPYFALSWQMTWFSHDVATLDQCARLFDLFISSHPLMPLYVAAVVVKEQRELILACESGDIAYSKLKGLTILGEGQLTADELARQAAALYQSAPPAHLVRQLGDKLRHSTTLHAFIENGRWQVPETPGGRRRKRRMEFPVKALHLPQLKQLPSQATGTALALLEGYRSRTPRDELGNVLRDPRMRLQGVAALTAMVFTGIASAAFIGTTLVLTQLQTMSHMLGGGIGGGPP